MGSGIDLGRDGIFLLFGKYFFPILLAMLVMASYSTLDGVFVSSKLGDRAMSAVVVVWPIFPMVISFTLLFGVGGANLASFHIANGRMHTARSIFSSVFYFIFPVSVLLGFALYRNAEVIVDMCVRDLDPDIRGMAVDYLKGVFSGLFAMFIHPLMDIFVINDKRPGLAMFAMVLGCVLNIVFNYFFLFVLEIGIVGSAYATILGHLIGSLVLLQHYIFRRGDLYFVRVFRSGFLLDSVKYGFPYSLSEIGSSFSIWLHNRVINDVSGDAGLSIYASIMYVGFIYFTILLSVSQSMQPMVSFNVGLRQLDRLRRIFKFYVTIMFMVSVLVYVLFFTFSSEIVSLFLRDESLYHEGMDAMSIYYIGYVFLGFNLLFSTYLQSSQRLFGSLIITVCYTFAFILLCIYPFAYCMGLDGIWISYPVSQICAFLVSLCVVVYEFRSGAFSKHAAS